MEVAVQWLRSENELYTLQVCLYSLAILYTGEFVLKLSLSALLIMSLSTAASNYENLLSDTQLQSKSVVNNAAKQCFGKQTAALKMKLSHYLLMESKLSDVFGSLWVPYFLHF